MPPIFDAEFLLGALRENPTRRAVSCLSDVEAPIGALALLEYPNTDLKGHGRLIAWVSTVGSARDLLDAAHRADLAGDQTGWARLPLRYGPFCSTWVLPEHPFAPQKAGVDD